MILSTAFSAWADLFAVLAAVAYAWVALRQRSQHQAGGAASRVAVSLLAPWLFHAGAVAATLMDGRFGFGSALSVVSWLVLWVFAMEHLLYPRWQSSRWLAALGAATVVLGALFPGPQWHKSASVWLPLHGALGVASYGLLAVAAVHAILMRRMDARMRASSAQVDESGAAGLPLMTMERLMMAFSLAAFVFLSLTLVAGWWFGTGLYGQQRVWLWNHKTVFSLLAWLLMALLLVGRQLWGWRGKQASAMVLGSAALLLLAYVGSRFVMEVVLVRSL